MVTTTVSPYDSTSTFARSGSPEWPIFWQPEFINDGPYHYTTVTGFALVDLASQYYTGSPVAPDPGLGGYYHTRQWHTFQSADFPSNADTLRLSFQIRDIFTLRERDSAPILVYTVPRYFDPPGLYGVVDPDADAASQRDWEMSDATFVGTISDPYGKAGQTVSISLSPNLLNNTYFSVVLMLDPSIRPSADVDGTQHDEVPIDAVSISAASVPANPPNQPPALIPQKEIQRLPSEVSLPAPEDPQIERRRWAETEINVNLDAAHWGYVREGDTLSLCLPIGTNRPLMVRARVLGRTFSPQEGTLSLDLQILHALDRFGDPSLAMRLAPIPSVDNRNNPTRAIPALWNSINKLSQS